MFYQKKLLHQTKFIYFLIFILFAVHAQAGDPPALPTGHGATGSVLPGGGASLGGSFLLFIGLSIMYLFIKLKVTVIVFKIIRNQVNKKYALLSLHKPFGVYSDFIRKYYC
jgi:hypothetical protein